jgi:hypothetical protein
MPRRKQRQLLRKFVWSEQTEETAIVAAETVAEIAPNTQLAKVDLPAVVENSAEQDENGETVITPVCRVAHVVLRVICASAVSVVVVTVTSVTRPSRQCR